MTRAIPDIQTASDIVMQIMTMHWDMAACRCWICVAGRAAGCYPSSDFQGWRGKRGYVEEPKP